MSQEETLQVSWAMLHGNLFYPGLGEIKKELSTHGDAINKAVELSISGSYLYIKVSDKAGMKRTIGVPMTNVSHFVLFPK
jgi:hypothetical protein